MEDDLMKLIKDRIDNMTLEEKVNLPELELGSIVVGGDADTEIPDFVKDPSIKYIIETNNKIDGLTKKLDRMEADNAKGFKRSIIADTIVGILVGILVTLFTLLIA